METTIETKLTLGNAENSTLRVSPAWYGHRNQPDPSYEPSQITGFSRGRVFSLLGHASALAYQNRSNIGAN